MSDQISRRQMDNPSVRIALSQPRGDYKKGYQDISFAKSIAAPPTTKLSALWNPTRNCENRFRRMARSKMCL